MTEQDPFEGLVADALDQIPEPFASFLNNIQVVVSAEPSVEQLEGAHVAPEHTLLGLYEGVPQTHRGQGYTFAMPDRITIFKRPILQMCRSAEEVRRQVTITVIHELAHHFGISDERLRELGW